MHNRLHCQVSNIRVVAASDLETQVALDTLGKYVSVRQKLLAGFTFDESLLYVREESVELWAFLQSAANRGLNVSVDGSPGTGKSTEVYAWALWAARTYKITVTWYHLSKNGAVKVLIDRVCLMKQYWVATADVGADIHPILSQ